jgi:hypothetical protein
LHAARQDTPPKLMRAEDEIVVDSAEAERRMDL